MWLTGLLCASQCDSLDFHLGHASIPLSVLGAIGFWGDPGATKMFSGIIAHRLIFAHIPAIVLSFIASEIRNENNP